MLLIIAFMLIMFFMLFMRGVAKQNRSHDHKSQSSYVKLNAASRGVPNAQELQKLFDRS